MVTPADTATSAETPTTQWQTVLLLEDEVKLRL
jgi:hypothetical protein